MGEAHNLELLGGSGLFAPDWYLQRYPDVAASGMDPARHYVRYGLLLGRDPGPDFDSAFYRAANPDLPAHTPAIVHYLHHGRAEGRFPTARAAALHTGMTRLRRWQAELWGGLEDSTQAAMRTLLEDPHAPEQVRFETALELARWLDFTGDSDGALAWLERLGGYAPRFARAPERAVMLSVLLHRRGAQTAARACLDRVPQARQNASVRLARANLAPPEQRLADIAPLFTDHGLVPVQTTGQASLQTLTTPACPASGQGGTVSVIMPVFNAQDTVETALNSLRRQSHAALEIIVVDDASTDDSFARISALAQQDKRIIPLRQPDNRGAYAARNRGLAQARGDFITTHDADDWSHPQKIERQLAELAQDPALMGVMTHWARVAPPLEFTTNWRLGPQMLHWSHASLLVRRAVTDQLDGWEDMRVSADMEFIWRIEAAWGPQTLRRILPDVPLALARDSQGSLTRDPTTHVRSTYRGLRHYYREISRYWHQIAPQGLTPDQQAQKRAMLPTAMWPGQDGADRADLLMQLDCCDPAALARAADWATAHPDQRLALSHHPDAGLTTRHTGYAMMFDPAFFALIQQPQVFIACPEERVTAAQTRRI